VTFCNSISVSEHVVMMILGLVRNYMPSHQWIKDGGWNIADCVQRAYDVEGMKVGTVASGRIGLAVLRRMHPFDCELHYCDRHRLPKEVEEELNLTHWDNWEDMVQEMDVVTLNCPLHPETEHMVNEDTIKLFKKGTSSTTSIVCRWVVGLLCRCVVVHACVCCVCCAHSFLLFIAIPTSLLHRCLSCQHCTW
jgi:formate dehydrogenase